MWASPDGGFHATSNVGIVLIFSPSSILWEILTTDTHALKTVMEVMLARHAGEKGAPS